MIRKIALVLTVVMLSSMLLLGCDKISGQSKTIIKPGDTEKKLELTILCSTDDIDYLKKNLILDKYKDSFEESFGVKVTYLPIGSPIVSDESRDNYLKDLASKLYVNDGAELIYCNNIAMESFIKQKAVLDLSRKVKNINKIYDGLLGKEVYYVPIGMGDRTILLNKVILSELSLEEPNLNWQIDDYYKIRNEWVGNKVHIFTREDYSDIYNQYYFKYLANNLILDINNNKAYINTPEVKEFIKVVRTDIFQGKYKLRNYTYENYYNMIFDSTSKEFMDDYEVRSSTEYKNSNLRNTSLEHNLNPFNAIDIESRRNINNVVVLPEVRDMNKYLMSWGYMINANGKNLDLAYEFINGMLEDEFQLKMLKDEDLLYPVSEAIEDEILNLEISEGVDEKSIEIKKYFLEQVKNGSYKLEIIRSFKEQRLREMLMKDLSKYIFADEAYQDEKLSVELQKLEDKYNIYLSE